MTMSRLSCASLAHASTPMICFSLEARHRSEHGALDETALMARHRLGARGNGLTFPLPWEDLLNQLREHDADLEFPGEVEPSLPRLPEELAEVVRAILKTNKEGDTTEAEVKSLIHQANVRRSVVVNLILDMKAFGHPSHQHVREEDVRERAAALPEDGVPPQVLRIMNYVDDSAEKLQPQKAATPWRACDSMQKMDCVGDLCQPASKPRCRQHDSKDEGKDRWRQSPDPQRSAA